MKLVIDIPDDEYKFIKDLQSLIIGGRGNCKTLQYNVINAIKNGTPYEERPDNNQEVVDMIKRLRESYDKGVMCSLSESFVGVAVCDEILKGIAKLGGNKS